MRKSRESAGRLDDTTRTRSESARELPADLRRDLLWARGAAYPAGYEES